MQFEPAIDAILQRLPDIGPARAYQIAKVLRRRGAVIAIGRRLYATEKLDAVLANGLDTKEPRPVA